MTVDRAWIGLHDGNPVFRISKTGVNVRTAGMRDLLFDWQMPTLQSIADGEFYTNGASSGLYAISTPNTGAVQLAFVIFDRVFSDGPQNQWWARTIFDPFQMPLVYAQTSSSLTMRVPTSSPSITYHYKWFLMSIEAT